MLTKIILVLGPAVGGLLGLSGWLLQLRRRYPEGGFGGLLLACGIAGSFAAFLMGTLFPIIVPRAARISSRYVCRPGQLLVVEQIKRTSSTEYVDRCITPDARRVDPVLPSWVLLPPVYAVPLWGLTCLLAIRVRRRMEAEERDAGDPASTGGDRTGGGTPPARRAMNRVRTAARGMVLVGTAAIVALFVTTDFSAAAPAHPPSLGPQPGCTSWVGSASARVEGLRIELRLCAQAHHVSGVSQWSSAKAGWSRRNVRGTWDREKKTFELRESNFRALHPAPTYKHCLVNKLRLTRETDDSLTGPYTSTACRDAGHLTFRRVRSDR